MASSRLCINNLSKGTDKDTLREVFSEFGEVLETSVMRNGDTGRSCYFGYVTFSTAEEAEMAKNEMDEQELDSRCLRVTYANRRR